MRQFELYRRTPVCMDRQAPKFDATAVELLLSFPCAHERPAYDEGLDEIQKHSTRYGYGETFYLCERIEWAGTNPTKLMPPCVVWRVEIDSEDGGVPNLFIKEIDGRVID